MTKDKDIKTAVPALRFPEFRGSEGWSPSKINHVCKIGNGRDYKHLNSGDISVYGSGGYMTSVNDYLYDGESACIGRKGTIDKPIFLTGKFWTVDTLFYTHSFDKCLPRFLYLIFQQINWYKYNEAGGVPSLSKTTIGNIDIFIPKNETEQTKIADCLSSLDDLISAVAEKIDALKLHKKGLMQQLFPDEGKTTLILRFSEFQNASEWKVKPLSKVCDNLDNKRVPITSGQREAGAIPYYGASGIIDYVDGYIFDEDLLCVSEDGANLVARTYPIAFSIQNKTWVNNHAHVLRFDNMATQIIVENYINSINIEDFITGMAQPKLNRGKLDVILIPLPSKIEEQQKIADCLSLVDNLISAENSKIAQLKAHKKGLMQQLFPTLTE